MQTHYQTYNSAEWQQIMDNYHLSGLNQKTFCQQEGLAMSTFSKWRKQLGLARSKPVPPAAIADFQPLMPADTAPTTTHDSADWEVELVLGSGMTLRIRSSGSDQ